MTLEDILTKENNQLTQLDQFIQDLDLDNIQFKTAISAREKLKERISLTEKLITLRDSLRS